MSVSTTTLDRIPLLRWEKVVTCDRKSDRNNFLFFEEFAIVMIPQACGPQWRGEADKDALFLVRSIDDWLDNYTWHLKSNTKILYSNIIYNKINLN